MRRLSDGAERLWIGLSDSRPSHLLSESQENPKNEGDREQEHEAQEEFPIGRKSVGTLRVLDGTDAIDVEKTKELARRAFSEPGFPDGFVVELRPLADETGIVESSFRFLEHLQAAVIDIGLCVCVDDTPRSLSIDVPDGNGEDSALRYSLEGDSRQELVSSLFQTTLRGIVVTTGWERP